MNDGNNKYLENFLLRVVFSSMSDCWKNSSFLFEKVNVIAMYFFYEYDFFLFLPEIFLLTAVLSFTLYGVIVSFFQNRKE